MQRNINQEIGEPFQDLVRRNFFTPDNLARLRLTSKLWFNHVDTVRYNIKDIFIQLLQADHENETKLKALLKKNHYMLALNKASHAENTWEFLLSCLLANQFDMDHLSAETAVRAIIMLDPVSATHVIRRLKPSLALTKHVTLNEPWQVFLNAFTCDDVTVLNQATLTEALSWLQGQFQGQTLTAYEQGFFERMQRSITTIIYASAGEISKLRGIICPAFTNLSSANMCTRVYDLSHSDFTAANFSGVSGNFLRLQCASLLYCDLSSAVLMWGDLSHVKLNYARLSHSNLEHAVLTCADLSMAKMDSANLTHAKLTNARLIKADLRLSNFDLTHLNRAKLSMATAQGATFNRAYLDGATLTEANFTSATFISAYLTNVNATGACFIGADMTNAKLSFASLSRANFSNALFKGADLSQATLSETNFTDANLIGCDLSDTNLVGAILRRTIFFGSQLSPASTEYAKAQGAIFNLTDLANAVVNGNVTYEINKLKVLIIDACRMIFKSSINDVSLYLHTKSVIQRLCQTVNSWDTRSTFADLMNIMRQWRVELDRLNTLDDIYTYNLDLIIPHFQDMETGISLMASHQETLQKRSEFAYSRGA